MEALRRRSVAMALSKASCMPNYRIGTLPVSAFLGSALQAIQRCLLEAGILQVVAD